MSPLGLSFHLVPQIQEKSIISETLVEILTKSQAQNRKSSFHLSMVVHNRFPKLRLSRYLLGANGKFAVLFRTIYELNMMKRLN